MFRSKAFTFIGVLALILLLAAIAFQLLELKDYEMLNNILPK